MASQFPPKKNAGFTFYVSLVSQADTKIAQANPTLAAGDVKVATDDAAPANLGTLPVVDADFTKRVKVVMSAAEMNGDNVTIIFSDAAGAEWCDLTVNLQTTTRYLDDLTFPLTSGRGSLIGSSGHHALDWANIASPTTAQNLSGTTIGVVTLLAANAIASGVHAAAELTNIADAIFKRDWSAITGEAARSLLNAGRFLRNRWRISGGTLTVYEEDDTTTAWTAPVTSAAGNPITEIDPT